MSVDEALRKYAELSKTVFSEVQYLGDGVYKASKLETAMKTVIAEQMNDPEASMMDDGSCGAVCKTFVTAESFFFGWD